MNLFEIGFINFTFTDLLDIAIVAVIFYWIYTALKDTIAIQILFGLVILIGLQFITEFIELKTINWILETIQDIWLLAFIVLFQPELRKVLLMITRSPLFRIFVKTKISQSFDEVIEAVKELSKTHTGALIVFPRSQNVQMTIDTGIPLQANVSKELLLSIFSLKSPLHDGAIVIDNQIALAARCILPLSSKEKHGNKNLGTRHKAALGLTEQIDAVVLIISEETGWISIADSGEILMNIEIKNLAGLLKDKIFESE